MMMKSRASASRHSTNTMSFSHRVAGGLKYSGLCVTDVSDVSKATSGMEKDRDGGTVDEMW